MSTWENASVYYQEAVWAGKSADLIRYGFETWQQDKGMCLKCVFLYIHDTNPFKSTMVYNGMLKRSIKKNKYVTSCILCVTYKWTQVRELECNFVGRAGLSCRTGATLLPVWDMGQSSLFVHCVALECLHTHPHSHTLVAQWGTGDKGSE